MTASVVYPALFRFAIMLTLFFGFRFCYVDVLFAHTFKKRALPLLICPTDKTVEKKLSLKK